MSALQPEEIANMRAILSAQLDEAVADGEVTPEAAAAYRDLYLTPQPRAGYDKCTACGDRIVWFQRTEGGVAGSCYDCGRGYTKATPKEGV